MYRAFNLSLGYTDKELVAQGIKDRADCATLIENKLEPYLKKNGKLSGSAIQDAWFPQFHVDVFISHSHADEDEALTLAALLKAIGLSVFIDSAVWGYSGDLLRIIDNAHCKTGPNNYSYEKRNGTTGHVHMMLAAALTRVMDSSEAIFFLNTPNSISSDEAAESTKSPWIFYELSMLKWLRPRKKASHRMEKIAKDLTEARAHELNFSVEYDVDIEDLTVINLQTMADWLDEIREGDHDHPLDALYKVVRKK